MWQKRRLQLQRLRGVTVRDDSGDVRVTDRPNKRQRTGENGAKSTDNESTDSDTECLSSDEEAQEGQKSHAYNVDNSSSAEVMREDDFQMMLQRHQVRTWVFQCWHLRTCVFRNVSSAEDPLFAGTGKGEHWSAM